MPEAADSSPLSPPPNVTIAPQHGPATPHHFEFDLDAGIKDQVVRKLENSPLLPLTRGVGPKESGIYALYYRQRLVYVGKVSRETTSSGRTLRQRLSEHYGKLDGRDNLDLADMQCRFLTFASDWWVWAAEFALIAHYSPEWNGSGYGSKVPGAGRPGLQGNVSAFESQFPRQAGYVSPYSRSRNRGVENVAEPSGDDVT